MIPLCLGLFFIYLSYENTTEEDRSNIIKYVQDADYRFIIISIIFGILSHISRAIRWKYLLYPLGYKPNFIVSFLAVLSGYLSNLGIPRSGEIFRASVMDRYNNIPFQKGFGTIIAERIVDLILLLVFICFSLFLQFDLIVSHINIEPMRIVQLVFIILTIFFGLKFFLKSKHNLITKINIFIKEIWEGIISIKKMKKIVPFIFHTFFIWTMYILMFGVVKYSIPETSNLGLNALIPAFVIGGLSITATNGGIGIYPYAVSMILISFGISKESSLAFSWLIWSCQTLMIIALGGMAFFALPLIKRQR